MISLLDDKGEKREEQVIRGASEDALDNAVDEIAEESDGEAAIELAIRNQGGDEQM